MTPPTQDHSRSTSAFRNFLARYTDLSSLNGAQKGLIKCPFHDDRKPSLSIDFLKQRFHCFGCRIKGRGLSTLRRLIAEHKVPLVSNGADAGRGGEGLHSPPQSLASLQTPAGCTLKQYAAAKRLPRKFLRGLGLSDISYPWPSGKNIPAVKIPFFDADGHPQGAQFRVSLTGTPKLVSKAKKSKKDELGFYGLEIHQQIAKAGGCFLVEGPSDWQTAWYHGLPSLALPGKSAWRTCWARCPDEVKDMLRRVEVYLWREPDAPGLPEIVARDLPELRIIRPPVDVKDVSALHLHPRINGDRERFGLAMDVLKSHAITWDQYADRDTKRRRREAWRVCRILAREPNILDRVVSDLAKSGLVGEERVVKLLYLATTSARVLPKPVSAVVKGPSAAGKNEVVGRTIALFPPAMIRDLTSFSERSLIYGDDALSHRTLVLFEHAGLASDIQTYIVRSLLSEQRIKYETTEKGPDGSFKTRTIIREGPTNLITTTTKVAIDGETETRLVSIPINDTATQTRAINEAQAAQAARGVAEQAAQAVASAVDLKPWHALQEWIALSNARVVIPWARHIVPPPAAVRLRRDFQLLLDLIRNHAVLHQATRKKTRAGEIIASIWRDYQSARNLAGDLIAEGTQASVSPMIRETVRAVAALIKEKPARQHTGVSVATVAARLKLDPSAAWRRVRQAGRHLKNLEDQKYRPARLVVGEALPDDVTLFPEPRQVARLARLHGFRRGKDAPSPPPVSPQCGVAGLGRPSSRKTGVRDETGHTRFFSRETGSPPSASGHRPRSTSAGSAGRDAEIA